MTYYYLGLCLENCPCPRNCLQILVLHILNDNYIIEIRNQFGKDEVIIYSWLDKT